MGSFGRISKAGVLLNLLEGGWLIVLLGEEGDGLWWFEGGVLLNWVRSEGRGGGDGLVRWKREEGGGGWVMWGR